MAVVRSFFALLLFQLGGEALSRFAHIPVPGPVLGMVLLATWYIARRRAPGAGTETVADGLLGVLGLLFVPAGVGIVANLPLLRAAWLPITVALLGSTLLTLVATAFAMHLAQTRLARRSRPTVETAVETGQR